MIQERLGHRDGAIEPPVGPILTGYSRASRESRVAVSALRESGGDGDLLEALHARHVPHLSFDSVVDAGRALALGC